MSRRITIGLIIALAAVLAYPAAAWVIGIVVEKHKEADQQKMLENAPYVVRSKHDYQRGIFGAVEHSTYQISLPTPPGGADKRLLGPWQLTTHCVIHHGPLPGMRALALATADCNLELPPEMGRSVGAALGGKPPFEAHIRTGWLGGTTTAFSSPAFTLTLENGATLNWRGLTGTLELARNLATSSGGFTTPGLTIDKGATHTEIGSMAFTAQLRRVFDALEVGQVSIKLAGATVHSADLDKEFVIKDVTVSGASSQNGDYVDNAVELAVDTVEAKQFSLSHVGYAFRLNHAYGPALAALTKAMRDIQRDGAASDPAAFQSKFRDAFREHGIDLLAHDLVLEIPRIGFVMPEGEARLSAKLSAPGLTREELQGPTLAAAILRHLQAEADFTIDAALLDKMLSGNPNSAALHQQLATLQRQGYVKAEGSRYTAHITYEQGRTVVNGLPFPPAGAR